MKKLLSLIVFLTITCWALSALADVGCYNNGSYNSSTGMFQGTNHCGPTTDINYLSQAGSAQQTQVGMIRNIPAADPNLFAAGVAQGDATSIPSTTTAIPVGYAFVRMAISSSGVNTAKTLANGYPGQLLTLYVPQILPSGGTTGGNATITPTTSTGWSTLKLSAVGDLVVLQYVDSSVGWVIMSYDPGASSSITITQSYN